jgi:primosomal replication protein N|tara:strand:+ start:5080 stop:5361 length:282 start_codon:yes stop_codon:yes gene_type:complete
LNNFSLEGEIVHLEGLRFTPAGLPVLSMRIKHHSKQSEAELSKMVNLEIEAVMIGKLTGSDLALGNKCLFHGFLEKKSLKSNQIIFHITQINK